MLAINMILLGSIKDLKIIGIFFRFVCQDVSPVTLTKLNNTN